MNALALLNACHSVRNNYRDQGRFASITWTRGVDGAWRYNQRPNGLTHTTQELEAFLPDWVANGDKLSFFNANGSKLTA